MKDNHTFLDTLRAIDKTFTYESDDSYLSKTVELAWLENDLYIVSEIVYNDDTGLNDFYRVDLMNEVQVLNYLRSRG